MLHGRVLVAHTRPASTRRALQSPSSAAVLGSPRSAGPADGCSGAAPSHRWWASAGWPRSPDPLGIDVDEVPHRALARRAHVRARVLRPVPTGRRPFGHGGRCARPAALAPRRALARPSPPRSGSLRRCPRPLDAARRPGRLHLPQRSAVGRSTWASPCRCAARARAHFCASPGGGGWTEKAEIVDYRPTQLRARRAGAGEPRLIKSWKPAGQQEAQAHLDRDRLPALSPRYSLPRSSRLAAEPAPGPLRDQRGPLGSTPRWPVELADQLDLALPPAPLRAQAQAAPSPLGQRTDGALRCPPAWATSTPMLTAASSISHFERPGAGEALIEEIDRRIAEASAGAHERAAALLRRRGRLAWVVERLEGVLRATHAAPRLVLARHPVKQRFDAFWLVRGGSSHWRPPPAQLGTNVARARYLSRAPHGRSGRRGRRGADRRRAGWPSTSRPSWSSTRRRRPGPWRGSRRRLRAAAA